MTDDVVQRIQHACQVGQCQELWEEINLKRQLLLKKETVPVKPANVTYQRKKRTPLFDLKPAYRNRSRKNRVFQKLGFCVVLGRFLRFQLTEYLFSVNKSHMSLLTFYNTYERAFFSNGRIVL